MEVSLRTVDVYANDWDATNHVDIRRAGLRATQFTLLQALANAPNISQGISWLDFRA
jgi:hypothetical protein